MSSKERSRPSLFLIMKILAITVYPLVLFPFLIFVSGFAFTDITMGEFELMPLPRTNLGLTVYTLFITILFAHLGNLSALIGDKFLERFGRKLPCLIVHKLLLALIFALFLLPLHGLMAPFGFSLLYLFSYLACFTAYIFGVIQYGVPYGDLLSYKWFVFTLGCAAVGIFLFYQLDIRYPTMPMVWSFFIQIAAYALLMGQSNIDRMMERRKHNLSHIPPKMRRYTMVLTGILLALTGICFLFRDWITAGIRMAIDLVRTLFILLLYLISKLASDSPIVEEAAPPPNQNTGGLPYGEPNPYAELIDLISKILLIALAVFLIYRFRRQIFNGIRRFFTRISEWFMKLIRATPLAVRNSSDSKYYADAVTLLSYADVQEEKVGTLRLRDWKRNYRHFQKLPDGEEKYRAGYKLVLDWLTLKGKPPAPGDTPLDILGQAKLLLPPDRWLPVTLSYNHVRYDPPSPPTGDELATLCAALAGLIN